MSFSFTNKTDSAMWDVEKHPDSAGAGEQLESEKTLYEVFRLTSLIAVHSWIYLEAPTSMQIRLLVGQTISLLEKLEQEKTTGWSFCHVGLFVVAMNALPTQTGSDGSSQRDGLKRLYDVQLWVQDVRYHVIRSCLLSIQGGSRTS